MEIYTRCKIGVNVLTRNQPEDFSCCKKAWKKNLGLHGSCLEM